MNCIDKYGSSAPRRYQIWINDLISEENYDAIAKIVANSHNTTYVKNTLIGMMVSERSEGVINFFFKNSKLEYRDAISICNGCAFELSKLQDTYLFKPIGIGRLAILNNLPLDIIGTENISTNDLVTFMNDLIQQSQYVNKASSKLSSVTEKIYKLELNKTHLDYELLDKLATFAFYSQEYSKTWFIPQVFDILKKYTDGCYRDGLRIISNL